MKAFHGDEKIKDMYLTRIRAHAAADELIKGTYWVNGKGCAVGCTVHSSDHAAYESELGIPRLIAWLEDRIFEGLPNEEAKKWPELFLSAINPGADLSMVWPKFAYWLLVDKEHGVIKYARREQVIIAINQVAKLYFRVFNNKETIDAQQWRAAASASAAAASASAAAASASAAYDVTRQKAYIVQSQKLLELLKEAR